MTLNPEHLWLGAVGAATFAYGGDIPAAVRRLAAGAIDRIAERITPTRGWADLVLTKGQRELLDEMVSRAIHRDQVFDDWGFNGATRGVPAMFTGPSDTGKTVAAEVVAGRFHQRARPRPAGRPAGIVRWTDP